MTVPFSRGTHSRFYADGNRRTVKAAGLGDISGIANFWLRRPSQDSSGNVAFGLGPKTASGNNGVVDNFALKQSLESFRYYQRLIAEVDKEIASRLQTLEKSPEAQTIPPVRTKNGITSDNTMSQRRSISEANYTASSESISPRCLALAR